MYRLKPERSIAHEVRRIADKQLALALEQLHGIGTAKGDNAVHEARRHLKKVRAVLRLVRPGLVDVYDGANRRLRAASRMLAPIADGRAVIASAAALGRRGAEAEWGPTIAAIRAALVARAARIDRKAELERVLPKVLRILSLERTRVAGWTLHANGVRAIAPGLQRSVRRARTAMERAIAHPTAANYHAWRRRVKDLWLQMRLLDARCQHGLATAQRRLEALDTCLGEYHDVMLLERILATEAVVLRGDTIRGLRLLRTRQLELRHRAAGLGRRALAETPRQFVGRVRHLWRSDTVRRPKTRTAPARRAA